MTVQTQRSYCDRVRRERSKSRGRAEEKSSRNSSSSNGGNNLSRNTSRSRSCSQPWLQPQQPQPQQYGYDKNNVYNQYRYRDISHDGWVENTPNRINTWGRDQKYNHQNSNKIKPTPHKLNPWDRNIDQNCNHQNSNKVGPTPHKLNPWDRSKDQNLKTQIVWQITQDCRGRPKGNIWETPYRKPRHVPRRNKLIKKLNAIESKEDNNPKPIEEKNSRKPKEPRIGRPEKKEEHLIMKAMKIYQWKT